MDLSFQEYFDPAQQRQLVCLIGVESGLEPAVVLSSLENVANCVSVFLDKERGQIIAVAATECDTNQFLIDIDKVLSLFPGQINIEETRYSAVGAEGSARAVLSDRFVVGSPGISQEKTDTGMIYLDHGSIFGSGHHPSTKLAVQAIEACWLSSPAGKVLDVGCGSGVLSFVCSSLGAEVVHGIDICQKSVDFAQKNKMYNNLKGRVHFSIVPISQLSESFDLIVANVSPSVLQKLICDFFRLLADDGRVVLSGLHTGQVDGIVRQMGQISCELVKSYSDGSWKALSFQRRR